MASKANSGQVSTRLTGLSLTEVAVAFVAADVVPAAVRASPDLAAIFIVTPVIGLVVRPIAKVGRSTLPAPPSRCLFKPIQWSLR